MKLQLSYDQGAVEARQQSWAVGQEEPGSEGQTVERSEMDKQVLVVQVWLRSKSLQHVISFINLISLPKSTDVP